MGQKQYFYVRIFFLSSKGTKGLVEVTLVGMALVSKVYRTLEFEYQANTEHFRLRQWSLIKTQNVRCSLDTRISMFGTLEARKFSVR